MIVVADVSNNQHELNLMHVKQAGAAAIYHKASEGLHFVDSYFEPRRHAAAALGIPFGAYHYAHPENDPHREAQLLCELVGKLGKRELRPALDLEAGTPVDAIKFARTFCVEVYRRLGVWPLFYSYPDYIGRMRLTQTVGAGLWLASYSKNDGRDHPYMVPRPWRKVLLHQFTSVGTLNGVPMRVDLSHTRDLGPLFAHPLMARL